MYVFMGRLSINDGNSHGIPMRSQEPNEAGKNHRTNLRQPLGPRILPSSMTNSMKNHVSMNEQCVTRMNILLIQHMYVAKHLSLTHNIMYSNPTIWRICSSHVNDFMLGGWCFKECIRDLRMIWRFLPELFFRPSFPASQDDFYETMIEEEEEPIRS